MTAHVVDGTPYALVASTWKVNFRGGGPADVLYDGRTSAMRGEHIEEGAAVAEMCHRWAAGYGLGRAERMMGLKFGERRIPTLAES